MADLDDRLRDLARAAEPSIRLAGPEAARARGHRRRIRQRLTLAVSAALTAAAVAIGSWLLLPDHGSSHSRPAAPPAPRKSVSAARIPASALLPPSALPFNGEMQWKAAGSTAGGRTPLLDLSDSCRFDGPEPLTQRSRAYDAQRPGRKGPGARHTINAYTSERQATKVFTTLERTLKKSCVSRSLTTSKDPAKHAPDGQTVRTYTWPGGAPKHHAQVVLMRSGTEVAVLQTLGLSAMAAEYTDGPSDYCMSVSLWRLDPSASASPGPYEPNPEEAQRRC
ncbi:hypothetical protein ABVG11_17405 [Streptomyces sp. HD1123-B1]|uniref:hypothetical protein n=1 Tax=Streptomyces huangiella TaxID=3228804 RepID=UPI003D7D6D15